MYHGNKTRTVSKKGKQKKKPVCVLVYNQYMGGVNIRISSFNHTLLKESN
jgi:hypothetical protein